jgi:hypothetical protein
MAYPGSLDSFAPKTDGVDDVLAAHVNDIQTAIVAIETELGTDPAGILTDLKTRLAVSLSDAGLIITPGTALTIASGVITVTKNFHTVDVESSTADDLVTINGGVTNQVLILRMPSAGHTVTLKNLSGNIVCAGNADIVLSNIGDLCLMIYSGAYWYASAGGSGHVIQDEGTSVTQRAALNFIGSAVSVADDSGNNRTNVTISASGGGDVLESQVFS